MCIDTRIASAPADVMPRYKPHLHKIQPKDPVENENFGYVRTDNFLLQLWIKKYVCVDWYIMRWMYMIS